MEGVGARLGRSSTRFGPATVFSGPVRKWKKRWVPLNSPNNNNNSNSNSSSNSNNNNNNNGAANSHLLLYKWTPATTSNTAAKDAAATPAPEEQPRRKFRYVPVSVIEEQKQEAATKSDDENKSNDSDPSSHPAKADGSEEKPDINDIAMEDSQVSDKERAPNEDVKGTNLDLSLNLNTRDCDLEIDNKMVEG